MGERRGSVDPEERFNALYSAHNRAVLRFASRRTDPDTARDVVAETFLIAWRRLAAVPAEPGQAEPWLYGVARRVLANTERSRRRTERVVARLRQQGREAEVPDPVSAITERERLRRALDRLTESDQEALRLVGWEELDLGGAALAMGCSRSTMAVRLHRARRRLERALQATESDERPPAPATFTPMIKQET
jgi:RNA polymerase sigma factor (sigma-70 family)